MNQCQCRGCQACAIKALKGLPCSRLTNEQRCGPCYHLWFTTLARLAKGKSKESGT